MNRIIDTFLNITIYRGIHWPTHTLGYEWIDNEGHIFFCETLNRAKNSILRNVYGISNIPIFDYYE